MLWVSRNRWMAVVEVFSDLFKGQSRSHTPKDENILAFPLWMNNADIKDSHFLIISWDKRWKFWLFCQCCFLVQKTWITCSLCIHVLFSMLAGFMVIFPLRSWSIDVFISHWRAQENDMKTKEGQFLLEGPSFLTVIYPPSSATKKPRSAVASLILV